MHQVIGVLAGVLGTSLSLSYLMQTARILRRRSSDDIALTPVALNITAGLVWVAYAVSDGVDWPLVTANGVAVATLSSVLVTTLAFRRRLTAGEVKRSS